jgi:mannose-6-phosphate isomerase-like protein (cupin superfamily)
MKTSSRLFVTLLIAALSFAAGALVEHHSASASLQSRVFRDTDTRLSSGTWGSIRIYTPEKTETAGNTSLLTALLEFLPGQRLQPPHQHTDEEIQYVISGTGTWHLNGEDLPLRSGDLMYTKPGDQHGIANTGTEPLRFLVVKWVGRNAAPTAN